LFVTVLYINMILYDFIDFDILYDYF